MLGNWKNCMLRPGTKKKQQKSVCMFRRECEYIIHIHVIIWWMNKRIRCETKTTKYKMPKRRTNSSHNNKNKQKKKEKHTHTPIDKRQTWKQNKQESKRNATENNQIYGELNFYFITDWLLIIVSLNKLYKFN